MHRLHSPAHNYDHFPALWLRNINIYLCNIWGTNGTAYSRCGPAVSATRLISIKTWIVITSRVTTFRKAPTDDSWHTTVRIVAEHKMTGNRVGKKDVASQVHHHNFSFWGGGGEGWPWRYI
jgi:hypothetical protein